MGLINLADAKVSYEGQTLPVINLISRLQTQLREAACRIAAISETLGDLQTALLNSHTVEVKLTLTKDDYARFRSMEGSDDSERVRKALMSIIYPDENRPSLSVKTGESGPVAPGVQSDPPPAPAAPVESAPVTEKPAEPVRPPAPELQSVVTASPEQPPAAESAARRRSTKCPTCQSTILLPETLNDEWPVELKCGNCGSKCLMKPTFRKQWTNYSI